MIFEINADEKRKAEARYAEDMERWENTIKKIGENEGREQGLAEGKTQGRAEGKLEGKIEIAKNLKLQGVSIEVIAAATNLTIEEINNL